MKSVLLTWELGGGLGHVVSLKPIVIRLIESGCKVHIAAKNLEAAGSVFADLDVGLIQAPHRLEPFHSYFSPPICYEQLLHNIGFGYPTTLRALLSAWRTIFDAIAPEILVFEHSPTAMLAASRCDTRKVAIGTGFTLPPTPLPLIRALPNADTESLRTHATNTLRVTNEVVTAVGLPPLDSLDALYNSCDTKILLTYPELDHFGERFGAEYLGSFEQGNGTAPLWPVGDRPKVFVYLKRFPQGKEVILQLMRLPCSFLVFCPFLGTQEIQELESRLPHMRFSGTPLNADAVSKECDLAISHGGHGLAVKMLRAGVPLISIPLHQEQVLLSRRLAQQGLGSWVSPSEVGRLVDVAGEVLATHDSKETAMEFARRYAMPSESSNLDKVVERILGTTKTQN